MKQPKMSVIIPAHNEEDRISASLKAILAQDYPDFEVIVVDNASTDQTSEVARSFPVTVLSEPRKGTMWACECGRHAATGEIIVRMDADCLPGKDWLSVGAAFFADSRVSAASGPYDYFDYTPTFRVFYMFFTKYVSHYMNSVLQWLGRGAVMLGGNSFMRASALEKIGGFNTDLVFYGDDINTAKRLATVGWVIFDYRLTIKTSARRFQNEGTIQLQSKYLYHFFKQIFTKAS